MVRKPDFSRSEIQSGCDCTYCEGKHVLDCFTHTGSFALNAAKGGAVHVHAVDISQTAIDMAQHHADINGLQERMSFETADVFDLLKALKNSRVYMI